MKKPNKSNAGTKRRQAITSPARPGTARNKRSKAAGQAAVRQQGKSSLAAAAPTPSAHSRDEGKRKLWERKQAELEARWLSAQTRQNAEDAARRRKMKVAYGMTGAVLAAGVLAWWLV
jgi:hypothetical protein